jgi:tubby-related protein 1
MDPAGSDDEQKNKAYRRLSFTKSSRTKRSAIANSEHKYHHEVPAVEEDEIGAITYTANLLGNRPRIMDVCVPKLNEDGNPTHVWRRASDNDEDGESGTNSRMLSQFKSLQAARDAREQGEADGHAGQEGANTNPMDDNGLMILQNRPPWWNVEIGAFVLNFGGRVSVASVKNFQLCERTDQDHIMLQFGRISGRHSFTMDFQYPLTPMQAFAIAISSLQSKISFG